MATEVTLTQRHGLLHRATCQQPTDRVRMAKPVTHGYKMQASRRAVPSMHQKQQEAAPTISMYLAQGHL